MKKNTLNISITAIIFSLYIHQGLASTVTSKCKPSDFSYNSPLPIVKLDKNHPLLEINSNQMIGTYPNNIVFTGNVNINLDSRHVHADKVQLFQNKSKERNPVLEINAFGNVIYADKKIILKGKKGWIDLNLKDTEIWDGEYKIIGTNGHGQAHIITKRKNRYVVLKNASFTSCFSSANTWKVTGSKAVYDQKNQYLKIWNAYFKIGSIPMFYSPYLKIPIGNKRHSGFLIPSIQHRTSNYFELYLPYYWNIASNIDCTFTPHYIYKYSQIVLENKLRYLIKAGSGSIKYDYLFFKKINKDQNILNQNENRWLIYWKHSAMPRALWRLNIDYTKTNDLTFFKNVDPEFRSNNDDYVTKILSLGYFSSDFNAVLSTNEFQFFNKELRKNYAAKPQLDVNLYQDNLGPLNFHIYGQAVRFVSKNRDIPESIRLNLEPIIKLRWFNYWASIDTETKITETYYQQKNVKNYNKLYNTFLKKSVNRILPQFKIDGKIVLDRRYRLNENYDQQLESHIQYLYVPYRDQSNIQNYDSIPIQINNINLFQNNSYSGIDRIFSANQVRANITTHIYNNRSIVDYLNFSIGQIYYFSEPIAENKDLNWNKKNNKGSLVWISDIFWKIADNWKIHSGLQYNKSINNIANSNYAIEYNSSHKKQLMQLNYRYVNPSYIKNIISKYSSNKKINHVYQNGISQMGAIASFKISDNLSISNACYFDTNTRLLVNNRLGIQYHSSCYTINLGYERKLNSFDVNNYHKKYDNTIGFNIALQGLSFTEFNLGSEQILRSSSIPYQELF